MPNPNTIPYLRYQDIQLPDVNLRQQFQEYMATGQYNEAMVLLLTNQQLQGKAYIASAINTIINGVMDLEERYYNGTTVFLSNLAAQYNLLINNLKRSGTWNNSIQYTPYNFVIYNQEFYMCIVQPPIGTLPTDDNYWVYVGLRGNPGAPGVDLIMQYEWEAGKTYNPNDLVTHDGDIYVALTQNTGLPPDLNPSTWLLFLKMDKGGITVGITPPDLPSNNAMWFQTQSDPSTATTTTPIIGQFKRYIAEQEIWDEMYPNTLFNLLVDADNFEPNVFITQQTIQKTDWTSNTWSYIYNNLTEQNIVDILPVNEMTEAQIELYNSLSISISDITITLTSSITPTTSLTIRIQII